jgi:molybdopterin-guanine dinucleotide biosynthesis protein A
MTGRGAASDLGAILLAGGRASRVGGAAKPLFEVGGRTLLARAVGAVTDAGARPITVVADVLDHVLDVQWVREDPPFAGPVAATIAALHAWEQAGATPQWTFLLACDLPLAAQAVSRLMADLPLLTGDVDGLCLGDASSRPQWLIGVYRVAALRRAAAALPERGRDAAVRALVEDLAVAVLSVPGDLTEDVDTWQDLERARMRAAVNPIEEAP